jgi:hypothetical protein
MIRGRPPLTPPKGGGYQRTRPEDHSLIIKIKHSAGGVLYFIVDYESQILGLEMDFADGLQIEHTVFRIFSSLLFKHGFFLLHMLVFFTVYGILGIR